MERQATRFYGNQKLQYGNIPVLGRKRCCQFCTETKSHQMTTKIRALKRWYRKAAMTLPGKSRLYISSFLKRGEQLNEMLVWTPVSCREERNPTSDQQITKSLNQ